MTETIFTAEELMTIARSLRATATRMLADASKRPVVGQAKAYSEASTIAQRLRALATKAFRTAREMKAAEREPCPQL